MSLDCTDCPINEPWPFDSMFFSQKFNGPAVKYEVCICLKADKIAWLNGPNKAGENDLNVFRAALLLLLADDEGVECDKLMELQRARARLLQQQ